MTRATLRPSVSLILAGLFLITSCDGSSDPLGPTQVQPDARFSLSPYGLTLKVGESATISPTVTTTKGKAVNPRALKWETTESNAASVDADGVVTGTAVGETLVVASSGQAADTTRVRVVEGEATRSGVAIVPDTVVLTWLDATASLTATVYASDGTQVSAPGLTWKSLNQGVAEINSMGVLTAKGAGVALIVATAACCDKADTAYARVQQVVDSVSIAQATVSLSEGGTRQLTPSAWDRGGSLIPNASFTWKSDNTSVVTVSSSGVVTAVASGTTKVHATSGSKSGASTVTVGGASVPPPSNGGPAELPRVWVNTDWVEPTGKVIKVAQGGDLQAAINSAQRGDVVELAAGATFTGNFTLPAKSGSGWVMIRSSGNLPPAGTRVTPANRTSMAKLVSTNATSRVLTTEAGATHYRIVGLELTYAPSVTQANAIVTMGTSSRHIILDRSYVHGHSNLNLQRCVIMHAEHGAVIDSWLSECHFKGADSQAIIAWNTNGPLKIVNNHLEGAGENVMLGGATPSGDNNPSDVEIRRNHFYKPQSWRLPDGSSRWTVKNLFEIKFGRRVLLEGNVFDGNWSDGQDGHAFNFKKDRPAEDITFRYNIVRNTRHGMKFGGNIPRWLVEHNLIIAEDRLFTILSSTDLVIRNNTAVHGHNIITSTGSNNTRFVATGNIWGSTGGYGVKGSGSEGTSTLNRDFPGYLYANNGHIGRKADRYPENNTFVDDENAAGFTNLSTGDLRLRSGSALSGLGADVTKILSMTAGVVKN